MVSDSRGIASSKLLPMGVYTIKEVSAPRYFARSDKELLAEIRHNGDVVKFEFFNQSLALNLTIDKKAPSSVESGKQIDYTITNIANNSSTSLENFYIHDRLPTDATRAIKFMTGTFNERAYYKVTYKTNYNANYRVLQENLLTKNNYEFSLHSNVLKLQNGEYVTDIRLEFDKVSAGFKSVQDMKVICGVMPNIPKDYKIVNRAEVGGRVGNEWESAKSSTTTVVWKANTPSVKLPRTGY